MPVTGVGNINDIDFDSLYGLSSLDLDFEAHKAECKKCQAEEDCEVAMDWQPSVEMFAEKFEMEKGTWGSFGDLLIKVNYDYGTYQVLLSPKTEFHGKCSPCYPGQANIDSTGNIECYVLPDEYIFVYEEEE